MTKVYINSGVVNAIGVNVLGKEEMLDVSDHAPGLVGFIPVFLTEEAAKQYADKPVLELDLIENDKGEKAAL